VVKKTPDSEEEFSKRIAADEARKLRARKDKGKGLWFGLGMIGTVGWSISVPTLVGVLVGQWMDVRRNDTVSWTLMLLLLGLVVGCLNAYYWVRKQR
jgi:ATP synthase protein I